MKSNPCKPPTACAAFMRKGCYSRVRSGGGFTLVEIAVSVALLGLVFATALGSLMVLNRNATSTRLMTSVREILQRNIETAVGVPFPDDDGNIPPILAITPPSGVVWDDGTGNPVPIYKSRDWDDSTNTGSLKMTGTPTNPNQLLRIVTREPTADNPSGDDNILRVTFRLSYTLYGRNLKYELTTIRARDQ